VGNRIPTSRDQELYKRSLYRAADPWHESTAGLRVLHVELLADTLKLLDLVVGKKEVPSLQNVTSTH
jgi:hypothetical protein